MNNYCRLPYLKEFNQVKDLAWYAKKYSFEGDVALCNATTWSYLRFENISDLENSLQKMVEDIGYKQAEYGEEAVIAVTRALLCYCYRGNDVIANYDGEALVNMIICISNRFICFTSTGFYSQDPIAKYKGNSQGHANRSSYTMLEVPELEIEAIFSNRDL